MTSAERESRLSAYTPDSSTLRISSKIRSRSRGVWRVMLRRYWKVGICLGLLPRVPTSIVGREVGENIHGLNTCCFCGLRIDELHERSLRPTWPRQDSPVQVERQIVTHLLRVWERERDPRETSFRSRRTTLPLAACSRSFWFIE